MPRNTGPRRLVLNDLNANSHGKLQDPNKASSTILKAHSSSIPVLKEGDQYLVHAEQAIQYNDKSGVAKTEPTLKTDKKFQVQGSRITLESSLIHSVYPPAGHTEYWNVLPHVLFNNSQVPWMIDSGNGSNLPWLALLLFTHDDLFLSSDSLSTLKGLTQDETATPIKQSSTFAVPMTYLGLLKSTNTKDVNANTLPATSTQAIFLQKDLYSKIFSKDRGFDKMSHVRTIDSTRGMSGLIDDSGTFAVTVSPRTGPVNVQAPTTVYAHLVALPNNPPPAGLPFCGLNLGQNIQPFRVPDRALTSAQDKNITWVKSRMRAGYTLARYRPQSGETTMSMHRGPLIPTNPYSIGDPSKRDMPASNFGSDLAILDREAAILDLTFQLAWELGRTLAMADNTFSSAVMRVKNFSHTDALNMTKTELDKNNPAGPTLIPISTAVTNYTSISGGLQSISKMPSTTIVDSRWQRPAALPGNRAQYSFVNTPVKEQYSTCCTPSAQSLSVGFPMNDMSGNLEVGDMSCYNENNSPASIDYANILRWVLDKWYLSGIPTLHLIPDPLFIPKETIRSFYVDPTWMKCFVDGALSITEHFTEADDIRESIKYCLTQCISQPIDGQGPSRIPKWGFFLRSEIVLKFPNLRISAPMTDGGNTTEVLRWDVIDDDLMIALFDRVPGNGSFPSGITIQPPAHQLCFALGTPADWIFSDSGLEKLVVKWKPFTDDRGRSFQGTGFVEYDSKMEKSGYDFTNNIINTGQLLEDAINAEGTNKIPSASFPALAGVQLIASHPSLTLDDRQLSPGLQIPQDPAKSELTTSAKLRDGLQAPTSPFQYNNANLKSGSSTQTAVAPFLKADTTLLEALYSGQIFTAQEASQFLQPGYPAAPSNVGNTSGPKPDIAPFLITHVYNFWSHIIDYPFTQPQWQNVDFSALYGIRTDSYIPFNFTVRSKLRPSKNPNPVNPAGYKLSTVTYVFPVGPRGTPGALFDVLPTVVPVVPFLPTTPPSKSGEDFPHMPSQSTHVASIAPIVRNISRGKRWALSALYPDPANGGALTVTAVPNTGDLIPGHYSWDLSGNTDISFVVEGVQVHGALYAVNGPKVTETYLAGLGVGTANSGTAVGQGQIFVKGITNVYWN